VKFTRDLPAAGWQPIVVTGPDGIGPQDPALAADVPEDTRVHRAPGPVPVSRSRAARVARWTATTSPFGCWWQHSAVTEGLKAAASGVDAILVTMSPFEGAEAAAELSRRLRVPWIADLRDPWALDEMITFPSTLHRSREVSRMNRALASAAAVVMNTEEARIRARAHLPKLAHVPVVVITNGWDAADFATTPPTRDHSGLRIVHTGTLHTAAGYQHDASRLRQLTGGAAQVRVLTRSHVYLLRALDRLRAGEPALVADVELHLAGALSKADVAAGGDLPVVHHGYLEHPDSVALLRSSDLLFLPMHHLPPGVRATIVPGKTYEYLATGRPVLAAVPDGDARDLLSAMPGVTVCRPDDVDAMAAAVEAALRKKRTLGRAVADVPRLALARYERGQLGRDLAALLDEVVPISTGGQAPALNGRPEPSASRTGVRPAGS